MYNIPNMKLQVIAHPNSKKARVEEGLLGTLHVYVNQPPLDDNANKAIIKALAKYFKVKTNSVILLSGEKSKNKIFKILNRL